MATFENLVRLTASTCVTRPSCTVISTDPKRIVASALPTTSSQGSAAGTSTDDGDGVVMESWQQLRNHPQHSQWQCRGVGIVTFQI